MRVRRTWLVVLLVSLGCGSASVQSTSGAGGQGGAGGTGGAPSEADCWASPLDAWQLEPFDMTSLTGGEPRDPMLSRDSLTLYYSAFSESLIPRIHEARRASRDLPFAGGAQLVEWLGQNPLGHPWRAGDDMFMAEDINFGVFHVVVSTFDGSTWSLPEPPGALINEGRTNGDPTLTGDGLRIVFTRQLAEGSPTRLVEGARSRAAPETPLSTFSDVAIPGVAPENHVVCPTLSPDGSMLFFSTVDLASGDVANVWVTQRKSLDHPWETPVHIVAFDAPTQHTCAHVLSFDGCEVWLERFTLAMPVSTYAIAKRSPIP